MRAMALLGVLAMAAAAHAGGPRGWHGNPRTDLFIDVPLDYDTRVEFPFGGSHHTVPGAVSINKAPYYCAPHQQSFRERAAFVEHLRVRHGLGADEIPGAVMVRGNQVRYVGD
ncbi:MAG: hypothetical protein OZ922_12430 [Myxococcales bacterium]|nr:hypothetical protein [Myxococcales bacterium]